MIGPISPQVPYEKMDLPMRVSTSPRSCKMGTSVPNAVVVRAMAAASHPIWFDWKSGVAMQITIAMARVTNQVNNPWRPCLPVSSCGFIS